ncbi:glycosyltransferase family 2 protein [Nitrospinota bacterium]
MKVVVPMAGLGTRLSGQKENLPKPLIEILGRTMVEWALESLVGLLYTQIIFVVLKEHEYRHGVGDLLYSLLGEKVRIVLLEKVTEGQLCSVLAARSLIATEEDLLIASADTYVISNLQSDIAACTGDCRGLISVAKMPGDHWSFVRTDGSRKVIEVAEKSRISDFASTGIYYFARGLDFVKVADEIIANNEKTKGEYYIIPVYQKYIQKEWNVGISMAKEMWDMGTPEAISKFRNSRNFC